MRYFFKTLFVYLSIFSLLNTTIVHAQNVDSRSEERKAQAAQQNSGVASSDADRQAAVEEAQADGEFQGNASKVLTAEWFALLNMLTIGLIASSLLKNYKLTGDMIPAAVGGAAYIAGEIYAMMKYKDFNKKQLERVLEYEKREDGSIDDSQIELFEEQKKAFQNAIGVAQTKSKLQKAAAAAFTAAAVMAFTKENFTKSGLLQCHTAIKAGKAPCKAALAPTSPHAAVCGQCLATLGQMKSGVSRINSSYNRLGASSTEKSADLTAQIGEFTNSAQASGGTCPVTAPIVQQCNGAMIGLAIGLSGGTPSLFSGPYGLLIPEVNKKETFADLFYNKILNLVFPEAHAGITQKLGLAAGAGGILLGLTGKSFKFIDRFLATPKHRAIVFGAMAAMSLVSAKMTAGIKKQMEENIRKIDEVIDRMKSINRGNKLLSVTNAGSRQIIPRSQNAIRLDNNLPIAPQGETFDCVASSGSSRCASIAATVRKNPQLSSGIGQTEAQALSAAANFADSISGRSSLSAGALTSAASLSGNQNALNRRLQQEKRRLSALEKKAGEKPTNVDRQIANLNRNLELGLRRGIRRRGGASQVGNLLGSSNPFLGNGTSSSTSEEAKKDDESLASSSGSGSGTVGGSRGRISPPSFKFDSLLDDQAALADGSNGEFAAVDEEIAKLNESQESSDDINGDPNTSLFKVISTRYLKSGFSRLLEIKR